MKQRIVRKIVPLLMACVLSACGGGGSESTTAPASTPAGPSPSPTAGQSGSSCATQVTGIPGAVPGSGGRYTLSLTAGTGCAWTAQSDAAWAAIAPGSGQGSGAPVLTIEGNTDVSNSRSANLTIGGQAFRVSQANACSYTIDQTTADVIADGSRIGIRLTTRDGCAWTARGSESWLSVQPTSGSGPDIINIEIAQNTGGVRHGTVTIANLRAQITQQGR